MFNSRPLLTLSRVYASASIRALYITTSVIIFLASHQSLAASTLERVAVMNIENQAGLSSYEIKYLSDTIRDYVSQQLKGQFLVLDRTNIEVLLPPSLNLEDCEATCEIKLGRAMGVTYIVTSEIIRFGRSYRMVVRAHQATVGNLVTLKRVHGESLSTLENAMMGSIQELSDELKLAQYSKSAEVTISSDSPGVKFEIAGERYQTPETLSLNLQSVQSLKIDDPCFVPERVRLTPNELGEFKIRLRPREATMTLMVKTHDHSGRAVRAQIRVDGKPVGVTPRQLTVPACSQSLTVTHAQHGEKQESLAIAEDQEFLITFDNQRQLNVDHLRSKDNMWRVTLFLLSAAAAAGGVLLAKDNTNVSENGEGSYTTIAPANGTGAAGFILSGLGVTGMVAVLVCNQGDKTCFYSQEYEKITRGRAHNTRGRAHNTNRWYSGDSLPMLSWRFTW